ncbi:MAG: YfhO family protein, partial [Alistipes sp.]|nr:YfhO family protein [Alistipes sp.]
INLRYMNHDNFTTPRSIAPQPTEADRLIMADNEPGFRVVNLTTNTFNDALTSNFHRSVGGYHPAKLSRYQDLIERYLSAGDVRIYNMLNSKYFITRGRDNQPEATLNPQNLGAAWFVDNIANAENAVSELERLNEVNLRSTAVVNPEFSKLVVKDAMIDTSRYIKMTDYRVNHHTYTYKNDYRAVAVFSEIYYPKGWTAYIDGKEAPYFRANYLLRAMSLPEGEHTVEFRFAAPNFSKVTGVTYACSSILLLGLVGSFVYTYLRRRKSQEQE